MEDKNIFVPLGGERIRKGGAGCVCMNVCGDGMRMQGVFSYFFAVSVYVFLVCLCTSETATVTKTSRQNVTKGANHKLTSASPDILL